jgi:16S rRNA (guanine966-N2)-methyltransferase
VRPTLDRVREAWMSILQHDIPGARVLDLYAGSGALGLEALSRGAAFTDFVETAARSIDALKGNIENLGAADITRIHRKPSLAFAGTLEPEAFDVAFADPPYQGGEALRLAALWLERPFTRILSVEHSSVIELPAGGDTRTYGSAAITIYRSEH